MNLVYLLLYTAILAISEALHHPQALAGQTSLHAKLTENSEQIEFSHCGSGERLERWQRSSERHH